MISCASAVCEASPRSESKWRHMKDISVPRRSRSARNKLLKKRGMILKL